MDSKDIQKIMRKQIISITKSKIKTKLAHNVILSGAEGVWSIRFGGGRKKSSAKQINSIFKQNPGYLRSKLCVGVKRKEKKEIR